MSNQLLNEGEYYKAVSQVERIYEFQPNNVQVEKFIKQVSQQRNVGVQWPHSNGQNTSGGFDREQESVPLRTVAKPKPYCTPQSQQYRTPQPEPYHIQSTQPYNAMPAAPQYQPTMAPQRQGTFSPRSEVKNLLKKARAEYKGGNTNNALFTINEIFSIDPYNDQARDLKRAILLKNDDVKIKKKAAKIQKKIGALVEKAEEKFRKDKYDAAVKILDEVIALDSSYVQAQYLKRIILSKKQKQTAKEKEVASKKEKSIKTKGKDDVIQKQYVEHSAYGGQVGEPSDIYEEALAIAKQEELERGNRAFDYKKNSLLQQVQKAINVKDDEEAIDCLDEVLAIDPSNKYARNMKNVILARNEDLYERCYAEQRQKKAEIFRKQNRYEGFSLSEENLSDIEEAERLRLKLLKGKMAQEEKRVQKAEERIRRDVKKRIESEEKENLDIIIKEVEESKFYETFKEYDEVKTKKEKLKKRQIRSFLLRAEGLMELDKYSEAAVYLNNVFMVEPYNEQAQKMRTRLENEIVKKEERDRQEADKLFMKEKKAYKKIRKRVREEKAQGLLKEVKLFYHAEEWLNARESAQKVLIIDPSNVRAKRYVERIDKKLVVFQKELEAEESVQVVKRGGAMDEAFNEAARVLELSMIGEKRESIEIEKKVNVFLQEAEAKIEKEHNYDEALLVLNRAFAIDPGSKDVTTKIQEARKLKEKEKEKCKKREEKEEPKVLAQKEEQKAKEEVISIAAEEDEKRRKRKEKEKKWEIFGRSKEIMNAASQRCFKQKVDEYIKNARKYLEAHQFEQAKKSVEHIFLFDKANPTAKKLLSKIIEHEVAYAGKKKETIDKEFEKGLNLEKLKTSLAKRDKEKVVRSQKEAEKEDKQDEEEIIARLLREGKKLFKEKRYCEALNKYEAVFAFDGKNKRASQYIDKVKKAMSQERDVEKRKIKESQKKEIREKLDRYSDRVQWLHRKGQYTEAAIMIEKGLLLAPSNAYFKELKKLNVRGSSEQVNRGKDTDEEIGDLVNLGIKEYIQGNYDEARKYFEKVLETNPNDKKAKNSIKKIDEKLKRLQGKI